MTSVAILSYLTSGILWSVLHHAFPWVYQKNSSTLMVTWTFEKPEALQKEIVEALASQTRCIKQKLAASIHV
jgi:hypothetical protein